MQLVQAIAGQLPYIPVTLYGSKRYYHRVFYPPGAAQSELVRGLCVHELVETQAQNRPNAIALVSGEKKITYRELNARANVLAQELRAQGVASDTRVGIAAERSVETVIGLLAILKAGGAYVPLDPKDPGERRAFLLADTRPHLILTSPSSVAHFADSGLPLLDIGATIAGSAASSENLPNVTSPENVCYVMYTSGSTGKPKGVCVPHRAVVHLVCETDYANFAPHHVFLQLAPLSFDASTFELWGALANGATLVLAPQGALSLSDIGELIHRHYVTTLWLTAGLFHALVDHNLHALAPLSQLLAGGDVLSPAHVARVLAAYPALRLINGYGPTETTTFALCHTLTPSDLDKTSIPIGSPIAGTNVFVLDEQKQLVPIGVEGELYIGGAGVAKGYLNQEELTKTRFIASPFNTNETLYRTGDRVKLCADGVMHFVGRADEQVKVRGFRIEPGEIENALQQHPKVKQVIVIAKSRGNADKELVGYVVLSPSSVPPTENEMKQFIAQTLPDYMVPAQILFFNEFPLTANGKIDRKNLPDTPARRSRPDDMPAAYAAPQGKWETKLVRFWEDLLRLSPLGANDNVFDLGAQSLHVIQVHRQVAAVLSVTPDIAAFFQYPTLRTLARYLTDLESGGGLPTQMVKPQTQNRAQQQRDALAQMKRPRAEWQPSKNAQ